MEVSSNSLTFYDFLDRMRHPASLDLVRSIKRDHPLWAGATEEEIDCAVEGLEKYVMTKLFTRTFASSEDTKVDQEISEKICLLQHFIKPEHLDIPGPYHNETSWLFAQKELQKMNAFKAPREKLLCILNCCRVINNLLLNVAMSSDNVPAGADDFLPILIYVTIKANPPQLHSNLKFIQLYRRQSKLISEAAYYFTNLMSAKSFIIDLDAKSLSINESEFQEKMIQARLDKQEKCIEPCPKLEDMAGPGPSTRRHEMEINMVVEEDYPFMRADPGELTVADVEKLLNLYKEVVTKYSRLRRAVKSLPLAKEPALHFLEAQDTLPRQPRQQEAQLILPQQPKQQDASDITEAK
ncbi:PREDICTED: vacuolar protein sorting-associated protein 9A-like isoform X2 [Nelumbo nucifera]|uniref:Vacuolar protein sorting-associated protein 9A-like isoform X2 n=1 Tax=Nelumbo nucifera TaxID=4432 RepID=A0A1U7ZTT3_NELNU|nr:PREDICTED: vacuolar protein sorting-associated protein 9A-like isoform X2 [Nelumbo nucifera]